MMKRYLPVILITCIFHILPISECMGAPCIMDQPICPPGINYTVRKCGDEATICYEIYSCSSCPEGYSEKISWDNKCGVPQLTCEKADADCTKPGACLNCLTETIETGVTGYTVTLSKQCQKDGNLCKCTVTTRKYNCATEYYQSGSNISCQYNLNLNRYSNCSGCSKCPDNSTCYSNGFTCKSGYYESDGSCEECPKNYQTCNSNGFTCPKSTYKTDTECKECPTGATCDGSTTFKCNTGYYKPQDSNSCTQCPTHYRTCDSKGFTCEENYYVSGNSCASCPSNATCNDGTNFKCNDGFYKSGSSCKACPANSTCTSATDFTCDDKYCKSGNKCEKIPDNAQCDDGVIKCNKDYYKSGNSCKSCGSIIIGTETIYATSKEGATSKSDCTFTNVNTDISEVKFYPNKEDTLNYHEATIKIKSCY